MARPRKPTNVLRLKGADRVHPERMREREGEPENVCPIGGPPEWLDEDERKAWGDIVGQAIPGVLGGADTVSMEVAAMLLAKFRRGENTGPELSQLIKLLSQFGMTPADRSKINLPGKKKKNAFADD